MKKILLGIMAMALMMGVNTGCDKSIEVTPQDEGNSFLKTEVIDDSYVPCGEVSTFQFFDAGFVTISNDEDYLYVTIQGNEGWFIKAYYFTFWNIGDPDVDVENYRDYPYRKWNSDDSSLPQTIFYKIPREAGWTDCLKFNIKIRMHYFVDGVYQGDFRWWYVTNTNEKDTDYYLEYCFEKCDCELIFRTQTPGGWGAKAAGNNPASYRDAHFDEVFPDGLVVGDASGYTLTLESAMDVQNFLPSGGTPAALSMDYVNPSGKKDLKNSFAGHIVALTLSVNFDLNDPNFSFGTGLLGDLVFSDMTGFEGMTVAEVLAEANKVLAGLSSGYSIKDLHGIISDVNESFVDGYVSGDTKIFECE